MSIYQVSTKNLGVETADSFIISAANASYYLFAANHIPTNTDTIPTPVDTTSSAIDTYASMIFGKRITQSNMSIMVNRYNWIGNTVYSMYEDSDPDLYSKQFYVLVQEGELYKVYKCLFNNNGGPSLVEPFGTDTDILEIPTDGYVWKYMYSFDLNTAVKFLTDTHMPIVESSAVKASAVPGSIDIIKILYGGSGYDNYTLGSFRESSDLVIDSDPTLYGLDGSASLVDNFYNNCIIKITSGSAAGEYRTITDYQIRDGKRVITIDSPFVGNVARTDTYEVYPRVFLYGVSGNIQENCIARAIVSTSAHTVTKIEVLNPGNGYKAASAELRPDDSVGLNPDFIAELSPIISPTGGHGSNVKKELGGSYVGISTTFVGNTSPLTSRDDSDYRTIGILKNPLYSNTRIMIDSSESIGQFLRNEEIYKIKTLINLPGNVSFSTANSTIYSDSPSINEALDVGDEILIISNTERFKSKVSTIIDDYTFTVSYQPTTTSENAALYYMETAYVGKVQDSQLSYLDLIDVNPISIEPSDYLVGNTSAAITMVNAAANDHIIINGRADDTFSGFNQLTKLYGEFQSEVPFIFDEVITQNPSELDSPRGNLYNYENNLELNRDVLYVSNVSNTFNTVIDGGSGIITGLSSNAYFISQYKYNGDLVSDSGDILYIENINPIDRSSTRSETIKLILRF